jgi:hypothetical protein
MWFPHNLVAGFWFSVLAGAYLFGCYQRWELPSAEGFATVIACSLLLYLGTYLTSPKPKTVIFRKKQ